jgi:hypothetical protein
MCLTNLFSVMNQIRKTILVHGMTGESVVHGCRVRWKPTCVRYKTTPPYVSLRGRTLKVIVKLANIVLTPEKPDYDGGAWHVEDMGNESIVATAIYYYSQANVTQSTLAF